MKKNEMSINCQKVVKVIDLTSNQCPEKTIKEWRERIPDPEYDLLIRGDPVICWIHTFCPHAHCTHAESSLHLSKKLINPICITQALESIKSTLLSCFIVPNGNNSFIILEALSNIKNELIQTIDSVLFFSSPSHEELSIIFNIFPNLKIIGTGDLSIDPLLDDGRLLNHCLFWKYNPNGVIVELLELSLLKKEIEDVLTCNLNLFYSFYISINPIYLYTNKSKEQIDATPANINLYITLNANNNNNNNNH